MDPAAVNAFERKVLRQPEVFFTPSTQVADDIKQFTKHVFDRCTQFVSQSSVTPLDQLYIDGFDADQIWEQLQLQNGPLLGELSKRIRGFTKQPSAVRLFPAESTSDNDSDNAAEDDDAASDDDDATASSSEDDDDDDESDSDSDSGAAANAKTKTKSKQPTTKATAAKTTAKSLKAKAKKTRDVAEDGFFDWDEMDRAAEEEEDDDDESEIDMNAAMDDADLEDDLDDDEEDDDDDDEMEEASDDDDDAKDMKYNDFFDDDAAADADDQSDDDDDEAEFPTVDRAQFNDDADADADAGDDDDRAERGILSSHQKQQLRLKQEITELEKAALGDKPWVLKGEVKSSARPENSLLEAVLDYDRPGKVAPVITVEVSVALEEMIKKRIVDDDFDDVVRKLAGNEAAQADARKLEDVSMEKSKVGLGEIYETEYMKTAMGFEMDDDAKQDQSEIDTMFQSLCWKLDALSNYQFTPKPMVRELTVNNKPSVPAIAMEEVVPLSVSDANLRAPEEIYDKKRKRGDASVVQSKDEMTQQERKALRNAKKHARRKELKQKDADERLVAKLNPGLGNKYAKKKLLESLASAKNVTTGKAIDGSTKQFSNSKEFFTRLQEQVQTSIKQKRSDANDAE